MFRLLKLVFFLCIIGLIGMGYFLWKEHKEEENASVRQGMVDLINTGDSEKLKDAIGEKAKRAKKHVKGALRDAANKYLDD